MRTAGILQPELSGLRFGGRLRLGFEAGGGEGGGGLWEVGWEDVEESPSAGGTEEEPADVVVDLDGVVDAGLIKEGLDALGEAELLTDIEEIEFLIAEELRWLAHVFPV